MASPDTNTDESQNEPYVDIYVVGTGMVGYRQLTREAEAALENAETIFLVHYQTVVEEYLQELGGDVVNLTSEYKKGADRKQTYQRMADSVIEEAKTSDSPVAFALYGHPSVFVSPSRWIIDKAPEEGLTVDARPGISSMDCLYTDINLDPAANGIQMYEATDVLVREYELTPDVPAMIWQIGSVETRLYQDHNDHDPERFTRIREYLQQFYPDDHTAMLLQTATYPFTESTQLEFTLDEFESMADQVNALQTLYLPPVRTRPPQNEEMATKSLSEEHLESITADD